MAGSRKSSKSSGSPAPKNTTPKVSVAPTVHDPSGESIGRVLYYDNFLGSNRANHTVEGFWFDQDTFENTVAQWADFDKIPIILKTSEKDLDIFCQALYGQNFHDAFSRMKAISVMTARNILFRLFGDGNSTAVAIAKNHFAQFLDIDDSNKNFNITIKNDLKD